MSDLSLLSFFRCVRTESVSELSAFLSTDSSLVNSLSKDGFTALQLACKYGFIDTVKKLLEHNADIGIKDVKFGRNCLHWACANAHHNIISLIIREGLSSIPNVINCADKKGLTPLILAIKGNRIDIVKLLLSHGADPHVRTIVNDKETSAIELCTKSKDILEALNSHAASDVNDQSDISGSNKTCSNIINNNDSNEHIQWGLNNNTSVSMSELAHGKTNCITEGWFRSMDQSSSNGYAQRDTTKHNVIVKLNSDRAELDSELNVRQRLGCVWSQGTKYSTGLNGLFMPPLGDGGNYYSFSQGGEATNVDGNTSRTHPPPQPQPQPQRQQQPGSHVVSAVYNELVTLTDVQTNTVWFGILLEKGLLDLHHLCDAMSQKSTFSRLSDLHWKLSLIQRICMICFEAFYQHGVVWYDLKPSNFIVFPADTTSEGGTCAQSGVLSSEVKTTVPETNSSIFTTTSNIYNNKRQKKDENSCKMNRKNDYQHSDKLYKWMQQSQWDIDEITVKATDLSSVYAVDSDISVQTISCTAKFIDPMLPKTIILSQEKSSFVDKKPNSSSPNLTSSVTVKASFESMVWSFGMTVLQLMDTENRTFYAYINLMHAEQIYSYLSASPAEKIQQDVDVYILQLVDRLRNMNNMNNNTNSCGGQPSQAANSESNSDTSTGNCSSNAVVNQPFWDGLLKLLCGILRVESSDRLTLPEILASVNGLVEILEHL